MSADRAGRDMERTTDFLVRLPRCDHPGDLDLPAGQSRRAAGHRLWRRPQSELAHLLSRSLELYGGPEPREHVVGFPELAHRRVPVADFNECTRQPAPDLGGLGRKWKRLELLDRRLQELDCSNRIAIAKPCQQPIARVGVGKSEPMVKAAGIAPHARQMAGRTIEITCEDRSLSLIRKKSLKSLL